MVFTSALVIVPMRFSSVIHYKWIFPFSVCLNATHKMKDSISMNCELNLSHSHNTPGMSEVLRPSDVVRDPSTKLGMTPFMVTRHGDKHYNHYEL